MAGMIWNMSAMGTVVQQDTASNCPLPQLLGNLYQVSPEREIAGARLIREMRHGAWCQY